MATLHDTALGANEGSGTALATSDSLSVTAGDLIVVLFKHEGSALSGGDVPTGASCADGQSNSYAIGNAYYSSTQTASNGDLHAVSFYGIAGSTGTITPTVTIGTAKLYRHIKAYSFTPAGGKTLEKGNVAAAQGATTGSPYTFSSGSADATAAGATVEAIALYGSYTLTPGSGWSNAAEFSSAGADALLTQYRLQSGSGSLTGDGEVDNLIDWLAQMVIFNEADAGGSDDGLSPILIPEPLPGALGVYRSLRTRVG